MGDNDRIVFHGRDLAELHRRVDAGETSRIYSIPIIPNMASENLDALRNWCLQRLSKDMLPGEADSVWDVWEGPMVEFALEFAVLPHGAA